MLNGSERREERVRFSFVSWNVLSVRSLDRQVRFCQDMQRFRLPHALALQETRMDTGDYTVNDGHYRLFTVGGENGVGGVGLMIRKDLWQSIGRVMRVSDRLIVCELCEGNRRRLLVSGYAPQSGRPDAEVTEFWALLRETLERHLFYDHELYVGLDANCSLGGMAHLGGMVGQWVLRSEVDGLLGSDHLICLGDGDLPRAQTESDEPPGFKRRRGGQFMTWRRRVKKVYHPVIPGGQFGGGKYQWGLIRRRAVDRKRWKKTQPGNLF
jgi:hypothetical protein